MFIICQLKRIGISLSEIVTVYCSPIRPILEYASPVWHCGLTKKQSIELENVQKRCFKIISPNAKYTDARAAFGIERLDERREQAVISLFNEIKNPCHILNYLLPVKIESSGAATRDDYPYRLPIAKTARRGHSFISYCVAKRL